MKYPQILKSFSNAGKDYRMYVSYYRGKDKIRRQKDGVKTEREAEIDLLIEQGDMIYPVEIKMSANPKLGMTDAFDVIEKIKEKKTWNRNSCMYVRICVMAK